MSAELLASIAESLGLKQIGPDGVVCGLVDGFPTQLAPAESRSIKVLFRHAGEGNEVELRAAIAESPEVKASGLKPIFVAVGSGTVTLTITDGFAKIPSEEVILLRMRAVLKVLGTVSEAPATTCWLCGSHGGDPVLWDGIVNLVCPACVARVNEDARRIATEYQSRAANWPLAFVGAVGAGVVGTLFHVGVMIGTDRMIRMLTIVTGIMVGIGTALGAGKGGLAVQAMAAIVTVLFAVAGELGYFAYQLNRFATAQGGSVDWAMFVARSPALLVRAWMSTLFALSSGLAGAWFASRYTRGPGFSSIETASKPSGPGNLSPG
ncbi:MAG TPA: hypothetical protein VI356_23635 [Myxococcales bacterium]